MKTLALVAAALCLLALSGSAGIFYYAGVNNGTWDNTTAQWSLNSDRSGTLYAWNDVGNGGQDIAYFNNVAVPDVKISGTVNANQVTSSINTDFRLGATGGTLNLTGAATINTIGGSNKIYVFYNTATGSVTGTAGFNTAGTGWVFMYGNNSFSGPTSMTNGNVFDLCTDTAWPSGVILNPSTVKVRVEAGISATCAGLGGTGRLAGQGGGNGTLTMNRNDGATVTHTGDIGELKVNLIKQGNYTQVFGGTAANNLKGGGLTVQGGVLALAKPAGIDAVGSDTTPYGTSILLSGGTLRLDARDQINNLTPMTVSGGTFNTNGFSETLAALTLNGTSIIDFGNGASTLTFSSGSFTSGSLTISNWSGYYPAGGGTDQLRFTSLPAANFLNSINFTGFDPGVRTLAFGSYFEVVPMPEPASLSLLALGGMVLLRRRR